MFFECCGIRCGKAKRIVRRECFPLVFRHDEACSQRGGNVKSRKAASLPQHWRRIPPSPKERGEANETTPVHICRRGDGSAIYAVGRGVSPSRLVGRSPRDRRPGGPRLSRPFGEAALMPLHLVGPARRAGRRQTGNVAILAAHAALRGSGRACRDRRH